MSGLASRPGSFRRGSVVKMKARMEIRSWERLEWAGSQGSPDQVPRRERQTVGGREGGREGDNVSDLSCRLLGL